MVNDKKGGLGERIEEARKIKNLTQADIARHLGISRSAVALWGSNSTSPSIARTKELARYLEVSPEWLAFGTGTMSAYETHIHREEEDVDGVRVSEKVPQYPDYTELTEVTAWVIPAEVAEYEVRTDGRNLIAVTIQENNSTFLSGDRVFADTSKTTPHPSGYFLMWDGADIKCRHMKILPGSASKMVQIDEPERGHVEVPLDSLRIIGRVVAAWKKM